MLDELNEVVLQQDRRINQLGRDLAKYTATLERLAESASDDLPHEKPPHY
jgi:uncharacterized coiled-coil protein SlyX